MIDWTKPHNWIGLAVALLVIGFVLRQVGARVPAVGTAVKAGLG